MPWCNSCNTDINLVWDWANGDVVCRGCGLVVEERFIDDRPPYAENDQYAPLNECANKTKMSRIEKLVGDIIQEANGLRTEDIGKALNIKPSKVWKVIPEDIKTSVYQRGYDIIKRMVYGSTLVPQDKAWSVIRTARKLYDTITQPGTKHLIQGVKLDRLVTSLVVIAADIENVCTRKKLCGYFKLNKDTLIKHEGLLQTALTMEK
jgi:transcription initiation factor TFIIIB Brf1 subunit/transcription initiation factor TFIIB